MGPDKSQNDNETKSFNKLEPKFVESVESSMNDQLVINNNINYQESKLNKQEEEQVEDTNDNNNNNKFNKLKHSKENFISNQMKFPTSANNINDNENINYSMTPTINEIDHINSNSNSNNNNNNNNNNHHHHHQNGPRIDNSNNNCILSTNSIEMTKFGNPPWWHRRTRLERYLSIIVLVSLTLTLSLASLLAFISKPQYPINPRNALESIQSRLPGEDSSGTDQFPQLISSLSGRLSQQAGSSRRTPKQAPEFSSNELGQLNDPEQQHQQQQQQHQQQQASNNKGDAQSRVCLTEGCVKAAAEILKNMDQRIDPCHDFYKYSCGNWIDSQVIPEDKTSVSLFSTLQDELNNKLRLLVERQPSEGTNETPIIGQMRRLYDSCMNTTQIEDRGDEPLLSMIEQLGGWPVLGPKSGWSSESASKFDWLELLIKFRRLGYSHDILIDLSVTPDFRNNTRHIIDLDQAIFGMQDRSYLLKGMNDSLVAAYYKLMVESATFLGADKREAETQMHQVLNFETQLATFALAREERRNISGLYNRMKISQLSSIAPNVNWSKFLVNLLDQPLREDEEVIVNVPTYFAKLDKLLVQTNPKVLANYMIWRVVLESVSMLGKRWRELGQGYSTVISGQEREEPRWEQCLGSLTHTLGIAISSMYVKNYFKPESKGQAMEMVEYIRNEFDRILDQVDWMDEETRLEAKDKAQAISAYIGYPDELLNDTLIEGLYKGLEFDRRDYFKNLLHLRKWSVDYSFNQLRKPNLKVDWRKHARAATVNAYYNALDNSIEFPAGILQGAFFDRSKPNYLNFGAIGFIIGHEITHGFDDRGRQFDKDGNNRNWWKSETDERFKERAQCIIDQYGNYTVPENGLKVNGINTQGENIADNGGLKEAFRAYNEWVKRNGEELKLPGIKLNQRQLFWVSAANVWCGKYRPEILRLKVMVGSHSPAQFRVTGTLSNLKEFSETFNCPIDTPLNPAQKCSVW